MTSHEFVHALYPDQEPTVIAGAEETMFTPASPDILVFRASSHWHLVSDGIRHTYENPADAVELTFRVPGDADEPPAWATRFFSQLATHFLNSSAGFAVGHHLEIGGVLEGLPCALGAADPEFESRPSPTGLTFVQLVGITRDELDALMDWDTRRFTEILARDNPRLVTTLGRRSILEDPATRALVEEGTRRDGSSMDSAFTACVEWERDLVAKSLLVRLDQAAIPSLRRLLKGRTLHGRSFFLSAHHGEQRLSIESADAVGWDFAEGQPRLSLTRALASALAEDLAQKATSYSWAELPGFTLAVA